MKFRQHRRFEVDVFLFFVIFFFGGEEGKKGFALHAKFGDSIPIN